MVPRRMFWLFVPILIILNSGLVCANNSIRELMRASLTSSMPFGKDMGVEIEEYEEHANRLDYDDCGKKFLCLLAGNSDLEWDEKLIIEKYSINPARMDYTSPTVQFNVATQVGKTNPENCENVYSNCISSLKEMQSFLRSQGLSIDIKGKSSDSSLYFLWRQHTDGTEVEQS
eukprot:TRINITY_DN1428_c0_g1_i4.p1 TRINITY_DN1428_c0_g1~~TRINITY_DN1428_c0_g1_i4.p1  ORF type:complete len:173 (-),score=31.83 TRINITY_DN1428_c0_g1_i4:300-818(-)